MQHNLRLFPVFCMVLVIACCLQECCLVSCILSSSTHPVDRSLINQLVHTFTPHSHTLTLHLATSVINSCIQQFHSAEEAQLVHTFTPSQPHIHTLTPHPPLLNSCMHPAVPRTPPPSHPHIHMHPHTTPTSVSYRLMHLIQLGRSSLQRKLSLSTPAHPHNRTLTLTPHAPLC